MLVRKCLEAYLADCQVGLRANTAALYRRNLEPLVEWLLEHKAPRLRTITTEKLRAYFVELQAAQARGGKTYSLNTLHQHYRTARTWLNWCVVQGHLPSNPLLGVRSPELPQPVARYVSLPNLARLLDAVSETPTPVRDRALIQLLIDTGVRRQELVNLEVGDVDLSQRQVTVRRGKGGRGRVLPLSTDAVKEMRAWLSVRPAALPNLFGLKAHGVYLLLRRLGRQIGVPNLSPHKLRHSFGTYYQGDIYDLAKIMGHRDIKVTAEVYRHRDVGRLVVVHDERSPLAQVLQRGK